MLISSFLKSIFDSDISKEYIELDEKITFSEFKFDLQQMENFRYRCEDIYYGIKRSDIKKEKIRKINIELLHSKQMENFFKENPQEKRNVIKTIEENTVRNIRPSHTDEQKTSEKKGE